MNDAAENHLCTEEMKRWAENPEAFSSAYQTSFSTKGGKPDFAPNSDNVIKR